MGQKQSTRFSALPKDCVSKILSFTTPRDVCRASSVSSLFRLAADSDYVWEKMLPPDYLEILARSSCPEFVLLSKKRLYKRLCSPLLIDSCRKCFRLVRSTGKKCYILSARELSIVWSDNAMYWNWVNLPSSRFSDVAVLRTVCWLDIEGRISMGMLSPRTWYRAYILLNKVNGTHGFNSLPVKVSFSFERGRSTRSVRKRNAVTIYLGQPPMSMNVIPCQRDRDDEWIEVKIAEFFTNVMGYEEDVVVSLTETETLRWKGGLAIEGIEFRPIFEVV